MLRSIFRIQAAQCRTMVNNLKNQFNNFLDSSMGNNFPQYALAGFQSAPAPKAAEEEAGSVFENWIWFAAPKSKISPSRKRQKHQRYFPEKVNWVKCNKCGEPKRPHRICTEHLEFCAMKPDEYEAYLKKKLVEEANRNN